MRKGANSENTKADLEDTNKGQNESLTGTVNDSLNGGLNTSDDDAFNQEFGDFGVKIDDPTELPKDRRKGAKEYKRKDTFVASFNITEEANKVLKLLQRRTNKSKKDIISGALLNELKSNIDAPIIKFNLPSPKELMLLRAEVVNLEAASQRLCNVLTAFRPGNKEQALSASEALDGLHNHLHFLEAISQKLGRKQKLLESISPKHYKELTLLITYLTKNRPVVQNKPQPKEKLARIDLMQWLLKLVIAEDDIAEAIKSANRGVV